MPRDYKYQSTRRRKRKPVSPWFGLLAGLLIGLFIALLAYLTLFAPPEDGEQVAQPPPAVAPDSETKDKPQETAAPAPPAPRFDFYTILPEMEVIVPEEEIEASTAQQPPPVVEKATTTEKKAPAPRETYYLQAGSFRGAKQADRFRARLALMGFETDIQTITINNRDTYHRVRVGPFSSLATLQKARSRLNQEGIETRTVRIKG